ncbi:MAG: hypothetical protein IPM24_26965 [Bryobacterales bacterium]|nr:hypothetical protein [Bryobacterales bacterium]
MIPTFPRRQPYDCIQTRPESWAREPACFVSRTPRRCWRCGKQADAPHLPPTGGRFVCGACCDFCASANVEAPEQAPYAIRAADRDRMHPPRPKPIY